MYVPPQYAPKMVKSILELKINMVLKMYVATSKFQKKKIKIGYHFRFFFSKVAPAVGIYIIIMRSTTLYVQRK